MIVAVWVNPPGFAIVGVAVGGTFVAVAVGCIVGVAVAGTGV
jgi:hypothetical protein